MTYLKGCAPFFGAVLMPIYHFWSPWFVFVRIAALLPLVYTVWWKCSVYIGIAMHCLINLVGDVLISIPLVFK